ncbi:tRNA (adenosine(37)-N6)-threonylcarbamoyltransferase complex dimerization subunit type 1 TsaB [Extensimonas vulgaris]|uniref:tRNA threonylcarbamoyladenosine biosynthesis protein TsaB n=1 Tax=Extensimonas vulgaris TaxID=1031594 RepID=A0A369AL27_9BURK|nr:tRNA (adenosine(37)-N6)-threonylcarbamoyltransferase complex dimerization subunit type 1 TsaB [Extensimonas vulgaris]RCX10072.1 tRNA threonylcarbamoyladenosine biosynthesis protein TsaB [Extensimonas vulgaris]TWI36531.1 tRNA threonylcarbamoyladenosine biosynthesis protein TsaB [Extensimonas vulgaris]TXD17226.1 tRNA (adenosine(37)-N6)-threonylcarbamoyltransferase complex dimerization subunit type 1 TsaB [Extensimonas vulgaris]
MKLLAFDTSTDTLSIAVQHGTALWQHSGPGGAQASATLIPTLRTLLAQAGLSFDTLDAIAFGRGPGSFTGLRTACAVAQGLALGARQGQGVPVLPIDTLLAVAEEARHQHGCTQVVAALDARMDEVYVAQYRWSAGHWECTLPTHLSAPEAVPLPPGWTLAGNAAVVYGARLAAHSCPESLAAPVFAALPTATALLRLAPALLAAGQAVPARAALPLYIRDKVAQTTAERAAARHAAATTP